MVYAPDGGVFHRPSASGRTPGAIYFRRQIRNWIWIFFRHYGGWRCWWKVTEYSALYLIKGLVNRQLLACTRGIVDGLAGHAISGEFAEKLTPSEAQRIRALNSRWRLRLWNLMPDEAAQRERRAPKPRRRTPIPAPILDEDDALPVFGG